MRQCEIGITEPHFQHPFKYKRSRFLDSLQKMLLTFTTKQTASIKDRPRLSQKFDEHRRDEYHKNELKGGALATLQILHQTQIPDGGGTLRRAPLPFERSRS